MIKNILVPTDFSNYAYSALFYATRLLASKECTFYLLNVYDQLTPLEGGKPEFLVGKKLLEQLKVASNDNLTALKHRINLDNENPLHRFETISKKGNLVKTIHQMLNPYDIDLIVMGSKGHTGAKEIFLGSNTIQVADTITQCPILTVPKQRDFSKPKDLAFVTDYKRGCTKKTITPLMFITELFDAKIKVMHINEEEELSKEQQSHKEMLELCLKHIDHSFHWVRAFSDKAVAIDDFLKTKGIDMFAMVYYKHSFFERLIHEPVVKDISKYTDVPFLILPYKD
ncbi:MULTISPECIES: universal stress protein [Zobellia]|uniref:Universal stress protein n=1 Tax=Zobellia galactanivorans (strain DSM 12802 / CCUG 47099 / CIP 106680 / NCIMB 13871 / Dsij) TaxID=63186 RepID=G0L139_ZOBGA|nr:MULTISPECIES: universal stress protein [Zobellia]MBU3024146.1 universal stress protein [Zobellia galactanivorans]OWW23656.1 hypothetical protein B4Q04_19400 [Zobellia sp. OII3]CAZ97622.1 Universal stress protein [Zobellia galactanivorans]